MVYTICYAFIFLAEILISLFYFENKFERKASKKFLIISLLATYAILYFARLFNITVINMLTFFCLQFLFASSLLQDKNKVRNIPLQYTFSI